MPYGCLLLAEYAELVCGTDKFAYNKVTALGIIRNPTKDFSLPTTYSYADKVALTLDIEVINQVSGEYDGSTPEVSNDAFGAKLEQVNSRKHKLNLEVEYNAKNWAFFNGLSTSRNYGVVFTTGNMEELNFSGKRDCTMVVKTPVSKELDKIRKFMIEISWSNMDLAQPVAVGEPILEMFR